MSVKLVADKRSDGYTILNQTVFSRTSDPQRSGSASQRKKISCIVTDRCSDQADGNSPRLVVGHPFAQTDEPLMSSVERQAVPVHQDALMTFSEVQSPETPTETRTFRLIQQLKTEQSPQLMNTEVLYLRAGLSAKKPCSSNSSGRGIAVEKTNTPSVTTASTSQHLTAEHP